jgi:glucose/arabinose dehydrogenase
MGPKPIKADDWTGKISRLSGPDLAEWRDVVVHLPRAALDHLNNQIDFGPDGALYFPQASNTAMGAPDHKWAWRPERLLTAAVLRLDLTKLPESAWPLDAKTEEGGTYDPFAPGAPLTIYASGVRNGYDLLWHSNGQLYVPINGSAAGGSAPGTPSDPNQYRRRLDKPGHAHYDGPAVPALNDVPETLNDYLFRIDAGGYYGHPHPQRSEYVLEGGNPTAGPDFAEVPQYPVGTQPDPNWRRPAFDFGKNLSPDGLIEYHSSGAFGGQLKGRILVARYSGGDDILVLTPGPSGEIVEAVAGIEGMTGFQDPVDLTEDPARGNLYVAEFGGRCVTLLRPAPDRHSFRVYRQTGSSGGPAEARAQ